MGPDAQPLPREALVAAPEALLPRDRQQRARPHLHGEVRHSTPLYGDGAEDTGRAVASEEPAVETMAGSGGRL